MSGARNVTTEASRMRIRQSLACDMGDHLSTSIVESMVRPRGGKHVSSCRARLKHSSAMTKRVSSVRASRTTASACGARRILVENITRRAAGRAWSCESKGVIPNP
eukprot:3858766-Heterocapsa_arctica.AAC.1